MKERIITGVLGAVGFLLIAYAGGWLYTGMMFLLAVLSFLEYAKMNRTPLTSLQTLIGVGIVALLFLSGLMKEHMVPTAAFLQDPAPMMCGLALYMVLIVLSRNRFDLFQMAYLFVGAIYIGYGFSYMMQTIWKPDGLTWSLLAILVTWANDSGAYFIGKRWGQRKLWPDISPNKTIEGSLGGVLFGLVMSLIICIVSGLGNFVFAIGIGLLITIVGQVGDLVESAWKRSVGVKDSGTILPGHGGVLDRFDSLIFTFIILYLFQVV
ncbi:phosphatidate cytidylyltransferase [Laceyella sacchari]|jgi:phosphatidate cytidylyltransferase|uniref:Phosphatidate cytidylyltransferase n=2 Tax=Laceyella TaxID=292635 RepID=A0AA45WKM9_9BACL|nr:MULTISPECIES: phosphatidate cytidylyltransferase [Laceyella]AUS09170.1 phosphatidate cytidylyltransferase [Laceyella sacchari]MRG27101.1 phosphatidate cytidylyltransferase [Laceyella tengchongensis]PRZ13508.1 phosphatidate cytidylyltransferase [Laceyella sediminis]SMP08324.1 phosphatidate cytidylyltransferase [Laceyella tengchongensis]